ncbi:MAG: efflux RND transporter periplasmic adaptor subunit [Nitrospirota bacterium]|jgi:HlyD family secretion protein
MRKWLIRLGMVGLLVAAGVALRLTLLAPTPLEVKVVAAERGTVEQTVTNSRAGTVKARLRAHLSPEVGGRISEIPHREGERVVAGEVLLRLDDAALRARHRLAERELEAAESRRDQACLAADRARRELARNRDLAERHIIAVDLLDQFQSAVDTADAACRATRAETDRARAAVGVARAELDKTVVRAPFDGVIARLTIEVGEWATPSPPAIPIEPVIDLINTASIYVAAPMDEVDSSRIHAGQPVRVTLDPFPGRTFPGRVARVAPYVLDVEAQNRTVEIEVELDDAQLAAQLLPGTSADVEVILEVRDGVLRIPTGTLLEGSNVLVVNDGRLVERQVTTGLRNWDFVEITSGLSAGEEVVTTLDRPEIKAGARVRVAPHGS